MSEFGDPANLDIEKLLRLAEEYTKRSEEMQEKAAALKGEAATQDGRVRVTCTVADGVSDLHIDPRAMRFPAKNLAETIKQLIHEATADLQEKMRALMTETYGEENNPMNIADQRDAMREAIDRAAENYDRVLTDALGQLEHIRRQMES